MARYSIREIIEMAVQTERLGYRFYMDMAAKFEAHGGLKDLFTTLATKEQAHERTFSRMIEGLTDASPEGWDEVQPYFRAIAESEYFLGRGKALPSMERVATVEMAVEFALEFEKDSALFFTGIKHAAPEKDKAAIEAIIKEETEHIIWLVRFRDKL